MSHVELCLGVHQAHRKQPPAGKQSSCPCEKNEEAAEIFKVL